MILNVAGAMPYRDILKRLLAAHFFVLPTLNENFGYVFIEALACGCPLLISDRTAWMDIGANNAGWTLPLEDPGAWVAAIRRCVEMEQDAFSTMANAARSYAVRWLGDESLETATAQLLQRASRN